MNNDSPWILYQRPIVEMTSLDPGGPNPPELSKITTETLAVWRGHLMLATRTEPFPTFMEIMNAIGECVSRFGGQPDRIILPSVSGSSVFGVTLEVQ